MSGETEQQVSGWTVDTLHSHVLGLLRESDLRYRDRFEAQEKAITKAEVATNDRLNGMNEFRDQQRDIIALFMPRSEAGADKATTERRLDKLEALADHGSGASQGRDQIIGYLVGAAGLIVAVVTAIVTHH